MPGLTIRRARAPSVREVEASAVALKEASAVRASQVSKALKLAAFWTPWDSGKKERRLGG